MTSHGQRRGRREAVRNRNAHESFVKWPTSTHAVAAPARRGAPAPEPEETALEFIFGLIVLALDIWAIINIIGSNASTGAKILWSLLIIILPIIGFIIWFFAGPRSRTSRA